MDDIKIDIRLRDTYGLTRAYPVSPQAHKAAALVGRKTLTYTDVSMLIDMGFEIRVYPGDGFKCEPITKLQILDLAQSAA